MENWREYAILNTSTGDVAFAMLGEFPKFFTEPPRVSRRPNFLREYPNEKYLLT